MFFSDRAPGLMGLNVSIDLKLAPAAAFAEFVSDLANALSKHGIRFQPRPDGRVTRGNAELGRILSWRPSEGITIEWHHPNWQPDEPTRLELCFESCEDDTRVILEVPRWNVLGDCGYDLAGWFASEVVTPLLEAINEDRVGDWITDRWARRPSGPQSRASYRDPVFHRPNFRAVLQVLHLTPDDRLLEVGCGGGAFLANALSSGCRAAAIDHSSEMVTLAREVNRGAVQQGKLEILEGDANSLPYPNGVFTCAVMTGVFGFLTDPLKAICEVARVLAPGGRFVLFTWSKLLRRTPALPEPMASRIRYYEDAELQALAEKAGFDSVQVDHPELGQFARETGIPDEQLALFAYRSGGQLLLARKTQR
jgi:SAM-dependent methyltransferase